MKKLLMIIGLLFVVSCSNDDDSTPPIINPPVVVGEDPDTASKVSVDRFSAEAGTLMVRDDSNGLPAANTAINFDSGAPFITQGLGPNGEVVEYYNFDVQTTTPAPIYAFFNADDSPVAGQLNVIDVIPGDTGYNDFWQVHRVIVPDDYVANTAVSLEDIESEGFTIEATDILVNCPVVPEGSTASKRMTGDVGLVRGWYKGEIAYYFSFNEKSLSVTADAVPLSPIYVTFNENPPTGGPATGFVTETGSIQTHNVIATLPADGSYSPLWSVNVYDNADFDSVSDLTSAIGANILGEGVATVNCPVVSITEPMDVTTASKASIDRFSAEAGTLMVRDGSNGLPEANAPINFDSGAPFITVGLSAAGSVTEYYNFDVQSTTPAPIYVLQRPDGSPVQNQLNIIDVIPGDEGYNDFWQVHIVTVPENYIYNTVTSLDEIIAAGFSMEATTTLVNCPVVPEGSTASKRMGGGNAGLVTGWYKNQSVSYFAFTESALSTTGADEVPLSPIYVTFNENPPTGGPATGFVTEMGTDQTHNVLATLPADAAYSPLWSVNVYDNADFDSVSDLSSAMGANILAEGVATVNCPVVYTE